MTDEYDEDAIDQMMQNLDSGINGDDEKDIPNPNSDILDQIFNSDPPPEDKSYSGIKKKLGAPLDKYCTAFDQIITSNFLKQPIETCASLMFVTSMIRTYTKIKPGSPEWKMCIEEVKAFVKHMDDYYSIFKYTQFENNKINTHFVENLFELDRIIFKMGYSKVKWEYRQPMEILTICLKFPTNKSVLAEIFTDLQGDL